MYLRADATEVLMKDHQKVQGMLRTIISSAGTLHEKLVVQCEAIVSLLTSKFPPADTKTRKENMNLVIFELSQHSAVEEQVRDLSLVCLVVRVNSQLTLRSPHMVLQILYPTLRHLHDNGDKLADRAIEEHLTVKVS
jgi:hypothetical protein